MRFIAGGIGVKCQFWRSLTYDKSIIDIVNGYKIEFTAPVPLNISCCNNSGSHANLRVEVNKLLDLNVISEVEPRPDQILSPIFLVLKPNGTYRLILNLKALNKYVVYNHFKMENINRARELISRNCFMASVDLEKAYYSISVHVECRKYLRFMLDGLTYEFSSLPFGLSSSPYVFTRLMKVVYSKLRTSGFISVFYLDDTLLIADSKNDCIKNVNATVSLLQNCGFTISWDKSSVEPSRNIDFLGFNLNSSDMILSLPITKRLKITESCSNLLKTPKPSIRHTAQVIGLIISAIPAFKQGKLHYRALEASKILALKETRGNFSHEHLLSSEAKRDLNWWTENLERKVGVNISQLTSHDFEVFTDASLTGFGVCYNQVDFAGNWDAKDLECANNHINGLELLAIKRGVEKFKNSFERRSILIRTDNSTAVHYINNMGGQTSTSCNKIAKDIWNICLFNEISLEAAFIAGAENTRADALSRLKQNTELTLNQMSFNMIIKEVGKIDVDLFANFCNKKCDRYVSWKPDPKAFNINAFTLDWSTFKLAYAFPPFSLLGRVLQKASQECSKNLVIVFPLWTSQPWFPLLQSRIIRMKKLPTKALVKDHPLGNHLKLAFGII